MTDRARSRPHSPSTALGTPEAAGRVTDPDLEEVEAVARIGSYVTDLVSGCWVSSPGLDAIFGIGKDFERTVPGRASIVHENDRDSMVAYLNDHVLGRRLPFDREYRIRRHDTSATRWVHGRGRLELDADGRLVRMVGTIADITAEHHAREALASSERRYAAIFEGTSEAILIVEESTMRIRWSNPAATALLGSSAAELLGLPIASIHAPEHESTILADFAEMRAGRDVVRSIPCRRRDGSTVMVDIRGSRIDFEGGAFMVGFFTDITSQEHAEEELRASELRYRTLVEQSADGILVSDATGRYVEANPAVCRMLGYARDELLSMSSPSLGAADDPLSPADMDERLAGTPAGDGLLVERRYRRKDGTSLPAEVSFTQLPGGLLQRTIRDITDRLAADAERLRLVSAVEQTSDAVTIADLEGTIECVNPAFERISGHSRAEAIGRNPRILKSGRQSTGFYRAMWRPPNQRRILVGADGESPRGRVTVRGPGDPVADPGARRRHHRLRGRAARRDRGASGGVRPRGGVPRASAGCCVARSAAAPRYRRRDGRRDLRRAARPAGHPRRRNLRLHAP